MPSTVAKKSVFVPNLDHAVAIGPIMALDNIEGRPDVRAGHGCRIRRGSDASAAGEEGTS